VPRLTTLLVLVLVVCALPYLPSLGNGFVNWDDPGAILDNEAIRDLGPGTVKTLFTQPVFFAYLPLYFLSLAVDHFFFGLVPFGYHAGNLLLHLLSVALVLLLVRRAVKDPWLAVASATVFGLHPVQVECVVWASGRKDVLATFLLLLSVFCFDLALVAGTRKRTRFLVATFVLGGLAVLAKATAVVLPAVLLLWQLVVKGRGRRAPAPIVAHFLALLLGLGGAFLHYSVARSAGVATPPGSGRGVATALTVFLDRGRMLVHPIGLAPYYPALGDPGPLLPALGAGLLLGLLSLLLYGIVRGKPAPALAAGLFLVAFLPYNTLFPATATLQADRYLYLGAAAGGLLVALPLLLVPRLVRILVLGTCFTLLGLLTTARGLAWKDSVSLWQGAVAVHGEEAFPHIKLGEAYQELALSSRNASRRQLFLDLARASFEDAVSRIAPAVHELQAESRLGRILLVRGEPVEAEPHLVRALELTEEGSPAIAGRPAQEVEGFRADLLLNLAKAREDSGRPDDAISLLRSTLIDHPRQPLVRYNLGNLLCRKGLTSVDEASRETWIDEGVEQLEAASRLDEGDARAALLLGEVAQARGSRVQAVRWFEEAVRRDPTCSEAHRGLSLVFLGAGDLEEALAQADLAVELEQDGHEARLHRMRILFAAGREEAGRRELDALLAQAPDDPVIRKEVARIEGIRARQLVGSALAPTTPAENRGDLLDEAERAAARALQLDPTLADACLVRGEVSRTQRRWTEARVQFERALALCPEDAEVCRSAASFFKDLGYQHYLRDERDEGVRYFERAMALDPGAEDHTAIRNLVRRYRQQSGGGQEERGRDGG